MARVIPDFLNDNEYKELYLVFQHQQQRQCALQLDEDQLVDVFTSVEQMHSSWLLLFMAELMMPLNLRLLFYGCSNVHSIWPQTRSISFNENHETNHVNFKWICPSYYLCYLVNLFSRPWDNSLSSSNLNDINVGGRIDLADSDPFFEDKTTVRGELLDGGFLGPSELRSQQRPL